MISQGKFGTREAVSLITLLIITKVFYTSIAVNVKTLGTAAWYTAIISCLTSVVFFLLVYALMRRFQGKNILEIFETVLGNVFGKVVALIFSAYFVYYAASNVREFVEMIKAYNLPYTPPSVIMITFIATTGLLVYLGLEGIARISYITFVPVIAGILIILGLSIPYYNMDYLSPFLGYGTGKSFYYGFLQSSSFAEVIILAIIINHINGLKQFRKCGFISLTLAGIIFATSMLCYISTFGYSLGGENLSGLFQLSKVIYYNRFFQRIEAIFLFIWVISSLVTVAAAFFFAIYIYCKTFKIENHRPLILPVSFLIFMISLLPQSLPETIEVNLMILRQYSFVILFLIPIFVLIIAFILGKKGEILQIEET